MKSKSLAIALALSCVLFPGCGNDDGTTDMGDNSTNQVEENTNNNSDAVTSPSKVTSEETLHKALKESWIVLLETDVTTDKDIILEGGFKKDNEDTSRVLAMFKTDADQNVIATYTLTAPKLIVRDKGAKIEGGTFKGDVYIEADDVELQDIKIEGNVYFSKEEYMNTFKTDDKSTITGVKEVKK